MPPPFPEAPLCVLPCQNRSQDAGFATGCDSSAFWINARDGTRLRLGLFRPPDPQASVFLFPGRTEYIEKYGLIFDFLTAKGFAVLAIDWRGQGASERLTHNHLAGHVRSFADYQLDVCSMMAAADRLDLPPARHLLAHSMGGAIGLRTLLNGRHSFQTAAFSAPMWGIRTGVMPEQTGQYLAMLMAQAATKMGFSDAMLKRSNDHRVPPGIVVEDMDEETVFLKNPLTTDREQWQRLYALSRAFPELMIGAPTYGWVQAALAECAELAELPSPAMPALISLAMEDQIVSATAISERAAIWPQAELLTISGSRHEVMFEAPAKKQIFLDAALKLWLDH